MNKYDVRYIKESGVRSVSELLEISAVTPCFFIVTDEDGEPLRVYGCGWIIGDLDMVNDIVAELEEQQTTEENIKEIGAEYVIRHE